MSKLFLDIDFWKESTKDFFLQRHADLLVKGFDSESAENFLSEIYHTVGGEYGD